MEVRAPAPALREVPVVLQRGRPDGVAVGLRQALVAAVRWQWSRRGAVIEEGGLHAGVAGARNARAGHRGGDRRVARDLTPDVVTATRVVDLELTAARRHGAGAHRGAEGALGGGLVVHAGPVDAVDELTQRRVAREGERDGARL